MSLHVEAHSRRGRSRSPGRQDRERSRSRGAPLVVDTDPANNNNSYDYDSSYDYEHDTRRSSSYRPTASPVVATEEAAYYRRDSPREKRGHGHSRSQSDSERSRHSSDRDKDAKHRPRSGLGLPDAFLPAKYARKLETSDAYNFMTAPISDRSRDRSRDRRAEKKEKLDQDLAYGKLPGVPPPHSSSSSGRDPRPVSPRPLSPASPSYEYASMSQHNNHHRDHHQDHQQQQQQQPSYERHSRRDSHLTEQQPRRSTDLLAVNDGRSGRGRSRSGSRSSNTGRERSSDRRDSKRHSHSHRDSLPAEPSNAENGPRKSAMKRNSSPQPPVSKMSSLSVNTAYNAGSLSTAPPSPLLESYHGTYQSMSPMPSPLLLPTHQFPIGSQQIVNISPLNSDDESNGKRRTRRARFADPQDDAQRLADALKGNKAPQTEPMIEILPGLTHEQIMDLRAEYKRLVKTGPEKKGVNVAKHIRVRLKDADTSLMKACYATALGRWESEAYWSSFWYQGDKTRRELLIESLMGRPNDEIRQIKEGFNDKTYDNSLVRCMKHELKEDKFKKAVLLVLEEKRMEDVDKHGRALPLDMYLVEDDVDDLRSAVKAEKGGESAMINIVVKRSDAHLREILRVYNDKYRSNFARDALRKSGNLVGELLAHILNGVINKPVRDALLIHHALTASKKDALRRELLTSRLVRFHWDGAHMIAVKRAYQERYGKDMMDAVADGTAGEWGSFCRELCITRMPDRVEKFHVSR
ncbi:hypothetical protein BD289DRAFT_480839 [Coniella lustricola]|uniref:Annexin ANXC4 n=1 Tax=Coniella lustricola TaxID=2025994 RepID=A0A2T3AEH8_9PEZI|nr:hypothetical protein BD289DRAFT_480839 [Coniella lustricola]